MERTHAQHLLEVTAHHHRELNLETERLRDSRLQAELSLETREMTHCQRVRHLEEQVLYLQLQKYPPTLTLLL